MHRWEYHQEIVPVNPAQMQGVCLAAGKEGWELCGMLPILVQPIQGLLKVHSAAMQPQTACLLQFKRPVGWKMPEPDLVTEAEQADGDSESKSRNGSVLSPV